MLQKVTFILPWIFVFIDWWRLFLNIFNHALWLKGLNRHYIQDQMFLNIIILFVWKASKSIVPGQTGFNWIRWKCKQIWGTLHFRHTSLSSVESMFESIFIKTSLGLLISSPPPPNCESSWSFELSIVITLYLMTILPSTLKRVSFHLKRYELLGLIKLDIMMRKQISLVVYRITFISLWEKDWNCKSFLILYGSLIMFPSLFSTRAGRISCPLLNYGFLLQEGILQMNCKDRLLALYLFHAGSTKRGGMLERLECTSLESCFISSTRPPLLSCHLFSTLNSLLCFNELSVALRLTSGIYTTNEIRAFMPFAYSERALNQCPIKKK